MATDNGASQRSLWNQTVRKNMGAHDRIPPSSNLQAWGAQWSSPAEPSRTWHSGQINKYKHQANLRISARGTLGPPPLLEHTSIPSRCRSEQKLEAVAEASTKSIHGGWPAKIWPDLACRRAVRGPWWSFMLTSANSPPRLQAPAQAAQSPYQQWPADEKAARAVTTAIIDAKRGPCGEDLRRVDLPGAATISAKTPTTRPHLRLPLRRHPAPRRPQAHPAPPARGGGFPDTTFLGTPGCPCPLWQWWESGKNGGGG
jgi:hypothetical protein